MWFSEPADRATSFSPLLSMVSEIKKNTGLPVMVSPGVLPDDIMPLLRPAGADWFACYQEIYNRELFARIRPGQDYNQRLRPRQIRAMSFVPQPGVPMKASRPLIP